MKRQPKSMEGDRAIDGSLENLRSILRPEDCEWEIAFRCMHWGLDFKEWEDIQLHRIVWSRHHKRFCKVNSRNTAFEGVVEA